MIAVMVKIFSVSLYCWCKYTTNVSILDTFYISIFKIITNFNIWLGFVGRGKEKQVVTTVTTYQAEVLYVVGLTVVAAKRYH
jgi:hypothetical protein